MPIRISLSSVWIQYDQLKIFFSLYYSALFSLSFLDLQFKYLLSILGINGPYFLCTYSLLRFQLYGPFPTVSRFWMYCLIFISLCVSMWVISIEIASSLLIHFFGLCQFYWWPWHRHSLSLLLCFTFLGFPFNLLT